MTLWRFLAYGFCSCSSFLGQLSCPLTSLAEELSPLFPVNTFPSVTLVSVWEMFVYFGVLFFLVTIGYYLFRNMEMLWGWVRNLYVILWIGWLVCKIACLLLSFFFCVVQLFSHSQLFRLRLRSWGENRGIAIAVLNC